MSFGICLVVLCMMLVFLLAFHVWSGRPGYPRLLLRQLGVATLEHTKKMKNDAIVCNLGHLHKEIDIDRAQYNLTCDSHPVFSHGHCECGVIFVPCYLACLCMCSCNYSDNSACCLLHCLGALIVQPSASPASMWRPRGTSTGESRVGCRPPGLTRLPMNRRAR